jgi:AraC-like DNA-binding protein
VALPTVSNQLFWNLFAALASLGVDVDEVRRRAARLFKDLGAVDGRAPVGALRDFWEVVVAVTGDSAIGVRVGSLARAEAYGPVGDVLKASATLGDALLKATRYMKLWNESVAFSVLIEDERAFIWQRSTAPELRHPAAADALLALILVLSRQLTGQHLVADEAHFAHPAPRHVAPYQELFGGKVCFDKTEYGLVITPDVLTLPIRTHDSAARDTFARKADELVRGLSESTGYARRVSEIVQRELNGGNPTLKNVASELGLHPKALTRNLKSEGTSHREILESRRRELAGRYVGSSGLGLTEVAFLLGFSDASAFNKSFRRWYGVAPSAFRASARGGPHPADPTAGGGNRVPRGTDPRGR